MELPLFFHDGSIEASSEIQLGEVTSRHIFQVLRMREGEELMLTDGKGKSAVLTVVKADKKKGVFKILSVESHAPSTARLHLAVAFTKHASRNEWLLEKAVELGVASIQPISSERSERERFRYDRWKHILVSALIQSRQYYLPELAELRPFDAIAEESRDVPQKLICHCIDGIAKEPLAHALKVGGEAVILIGPEGDFSAEEVKLALVNGYRGIDLGHQRLRTETAAMSVCSYFNLINHEA